MPLPTWFQKYAVDGIDSEFYETLRSEKLILLPDQSEDLQLLRAYRDRVAGEMDSEESQHPPMLWSGIQPPETHGEATCDYYMVVSVGGTKTEVALLRLEKGQLIGLNPETGEEVKTQEEILKIKDDSKMTTPKYSEEHCPTGFDMLRQIAEFIAGLFKEEGKKALARCGGILLSWGYAHQIVRTQQGLLGGLAGLVTEMSKDQLEFTPHLQGKDVAALLRDEIDKALNWSAPVTIANDTVMAAFYFLSNEWSDFNKVGLFINGTGMNFALPEKYAIRNEGYVSEGDDTYVPQRISESRPLGESETEMDFFVNYETGSIKLAETRTRFDEDEEFQIERNITAGGHAFPSQMKRMMTEFISKEFFESMLVSISANELGSYEAGKIAGGASFNEIFPNVEATEQQMQIVFGICKTLLSRSALHIAIVLSSVTKRNGYGLGSHQKLDLLGMEGSLWQMPGFQELVYGWWELLNDEEKLNIEFAHEPSFNASLPGPLFLAALQGE